LKLAIKKPQCSSDLLHGLYLDWRDQEETGIDFGERKHIVDDALLVSYTCHDCLGAVQARFDRVSSDRDLLARVAQNIAEGRYYALDTAVMHVVSNALV
jgi:hypothetical protein